MSTDKTENPAAPLENVLALMGFGVLIGVVVIVLDLFDVSFFDGRGPGSGVIIFGLGIFALVFEGLRTGGLPILGGFIVRSVLPPVFWVSLALYALAGITMLVVGSLMIFEVIEG